MKMCVVCGTPSVGSRCPEHSDKDRNARGYDAAWRRLSTKARRLQPFCSDCGALDDLQLDHTPEAWARWLQHKPIRLQDVAVVCGRCNRQRGAARGQQVGREPAKVKRDTQPQAKFENENGSHMVEGR